MTSQEESRAQSPRACFLFPENNTEARGRGCPSGPQGRSRGGVCSPRRVTSFSARRCARPPAPHGPARLASRFIDSCPQAATAVASRLGREASSRPTGDPAPAAFLVASFVMVLSPQNPLSGVPQLRGCTLARTLEPGPRVPRPFDFQQTLTAGDTPCLQKDEQPPAAGNRFVQTAGLAELHEPGVCPPGDKNDRALPPRRTLRGCCPRRLWEQSLSASCKLLQLSGTRDRV